MATKTMTGAIHQLRRTVFLPDGGGLSDGQLLECFLSQRDEAAFEVLVRRHGPMVLGVCRRIAGNLADAEDAFQATFLVLVRKAASLRSRDLLANWLYGVAYRTALKARAATARRQARERQVREMQCMKCSTSPEVETDQAWRELLPLLDQELHRLPEKYRVAVVLCDLQGRTRTEAARQLDLPAGTLSGRLTTARRMLARRLKRHGLTLSGGAVAGALGTQAASASVPAALVGSTVQAAIQVAVGQAAAWSGISAAVAALTEGVLTTMLLTKLKIVCVVLLAIGVLGGGAGWLVHHALAQKPLRQASQEEKKPVKPVKEGKTATREVSGTVQALAADQSTISIVGKEFVGIKTFPVARDARVFLDDGTGDKLGFTEGKLTNVTERSFVVLRLSPNQQTVIALWVEGPTVQGVLQAVDPANHTLTVLGKASKVEPGVEKTYSIDPNARISISSRSDKKAAPPSAKLTDLKAGVLVTLKLSGDQKLVGSIRAEGQSVFGVLNAVDAGKNTITITGKEGEKTYEVARDARVSLDDGNSKKGPFKESKLADLPVGAAVSVELSLDQKLAVAIHVVGRSISGILKAVDAGKNTITVTVTVGKGEPTEERTFAVAKDARIKIDAGKSDAGKDAKLADLPVDALVVAKLSADQKAIVSLSTEGPSVSGVVKGKAGDNRITLGNKVGEQTYNVARDTRILIEGKEGKLTDLVDGAVVSAKLSSDKKELIGSINAEGQSFRGVVKGVDPTNGTITLTIGGKGGVGGEDKTFSVTTQTQIATEIYGVSRKLADVRVDREVSLRLTLDQKAVARLTIVGE